jgi:hypothetical protein
MGERSQVLLSHPLGDGDGSRLVSGSDDGELSGCGSSDGSALLVDSGTGVGLDDDATWGAGAVAGSSTVWSTTAE